MNPDSPSLRTLRTPAHPVALALLAALVSTLANAEAPAIANSVAVPTTSTHRDGDDLLTAGLGIDGLR
ncbi:MAG: hypothetical protein ACOVKB_03435, partial [Silanimonas sp.]